MQLKTLSITVLEGVTFALKDAIEIARGLGISIDRIRLTGGGAKSPLWRQMNVPVPIAPAALSPAPAITFTFCGNDNSFAACFVKVPTTS